MQEYKRQIDRESRWLSNGSNGSPNGDGIQAIGRSSHKTIEAVMQSAAKGKVWGRATTMFNVWCEMIFWLFLLVPPYKIKHWFVCGGIFGCYLILVIIVTNSNAELLPFQVQTIRQGYLSKRSSNLRGDWKRRFFVLDSRGMLYYYRKESSKPSVSYPYVSCVCKLCILVFRSLDPCTSLWLTAVVGFINRPLVLGAQVRGIVQNSDLDCLVAGFLHIIMVVCMMRNLLHIILWIY